MNRNFAEITATLAQASEAPALAPAMEQIPFAEFGFVAIAALWCLQYFLKHASTQSTESWQMLERLVESQQKSNDTLVRTNHELTLRLARVHERLERIERVLLDGQRGK